MTRSAADRLIVALDVATIDVAKRLVSELKDLVFAFKVGFNLWMQKDSDDLFAMILDNKKKVFIDAKLYDIENTIEQAVRAAAARNFSFITVHHNEKVVRAAVKGRGASDLKIFVVTVLTMLDNENFKDMGIEKTVDDFVEWNTRRALQFGCDGVIAAATDNLKMIKDLAKSENKEFLIATPGIRPSGAQAIEAGADYLIVGRPIYGADYPAEAAKKIIDEIETAVAKMEGIGDQRLLDRSQ